VGFDRCPHEAPECECVRRRTKLGSSIRKLIASASVSHMACREQDEGGSGENSGPYSASGHRRGLQASGAG